MKKDNLQNKKEERNSFVMYTEYRKHLKMLTSEEQGHIFMALLEYAETGEEPTLSGMSAMAFSFIKAQMDRDTEKYEQVVAARSEAGKKGGRPKNEGDSAENHADEDKPNGFSEKQTETKKPIAFSEKQTEAKKANGYFEKQTKAKKPDNVYVYVDGDVNDNALSHVDVDEDVTGNADKDGDVNMGAGGVGANERKAQNEKEEKKEKENGNITPFKSPYDECEHKIVTYDGPPLTGALSQKKLEQLSRRHPVDKRGKRKL